VAEDSFTGSVFVRAAEDLVKKVELETDPKGLALAADAQRLLTLFRGWLQQRPSAAERTEAVNQLIDLNRTVLVYFSKQTRG
jgi:hypothetical protein